MTLNFTTQSPEETRALGERIGRSLLAGDVLFMYGDLGAGKTALAQGIACGLGVPDEEYVRSPTFTLINQYHGSLPVNHIDLYRLDDPHSIEQLGLEEVISDENVTLIEWAEKLGSNSKDVPLGLTHGWRITLDSTSESSRNIVIFPLGKVPSGHLLLTLQ